ncbi:hypothetical protein M422DRAFT_35479 [Sphaerobolus stellatus SS14]|uniref:3-phytase n=1 Tax=Sphaerobolus stellatus (strain SS14) TaxID=990650 RepID=A0A0C9TTE7_SPHS4|nr:hypothetical protein M422DRAFT_35479 [Sphaerobolus stellatus SS14]
MADIERGNYEPLNTQDEHQGLLSDKVEDIAPTTTPNRRSQQQARYSRYHLGVSFIVGGLAFSVVQYLLLPLCLIGKFGSSTRNDLTDDPTAKAWQYADPWAGSTLIHPFPPTSPTNVFPSLFPSNVGYAGPTPTGAEPAVAVTAGYPIHTGAPHLVEPGTLGKTMAKSSGFDIFKKWGNLSPWYSNERGAFGLDSSPEPPETCSITGLHFLHRHGARYPTAWSAYGGPAKFATKLAKTNKNWNATGDLEFLNGWTYKLGEEVLTPFGRQQLYDLGVSLRIKYGFLLNEFTEKNKLPVFRTESQDRMLASAMNFALGFFGWPIENQYQQSITIEAPGFNNTLAPYMTCPNARIPSKADRALSYMKEWTSIYLKDARKRIQAQLNGFKLSTEDVYILQQLCAYETVALGHSSFCALFTEEEWEGFEYALDIYFWYDSAFGSPVARVQGVGYINELLARLTRTPIKVHNTSTNATLDNNPITFPLHNNLYVDATHEVVVLNVITALNLSNFAASGPLPADHIPANRSFISSQIAPFATNIQFQLLNCTSLPEPQIRIIINDGVTPLTGIKGCPEQKDGLCPLNTFVESQQKLAAETDWEWACHGDWELPVGPAWNTTTGDPPKRS